MTSDFRPCYLIVKLPGGELPGDAARLVAEARGELLVAAAAAEVTVLETGTTHTALLVARFAFREDLDGAWASLAPLVGGDATVLASRGLAYEGWPGSPVPTIASVLVPAGDTPRAFMLIEGTGTDQGRMDAYRDVILPMLRERGSYYPLYELGGGVEVLAGRWSEGVLAISRWPTIAAARDWWFSDRYQQVAIPIRTGFGRFEVQLAEGLAG